MPTKPETLLVNRILRELRARYGADLWITKVHGSLFQQRGLPDLVACYRGWYVAFEVKRPGEQPTALQEYTLGEITRSGGFARVISTVEDATLALDALQERGKVEGRTTT